MLFFESIDKQYFKLIFTYDIDKNVGIAGFEGRLVLMCKAEEEHGIIYDLLNRSQIPLRVLKSTTFLSSLQRI